MRPLLHRLSDYNFHHGVATQARCAPERAHRLIGAFGEDEINDWFAARLERNELRGYLDDLAIVADLAAGSAGDPAARVGLELRYALIEGTIRGIADHLPPPLITRLIEEGIFTPDQATFWGQLNTAPGGGFELMIETLRSSRSTALAERWLEAVDVGARISDADNKVLSVIKFIADVPAHLRQRVLNVIEQEPNEGSRSGALRRLAEISGLDEATRSEMWRIATEIKQDNLRTEAVVEVGWQMGPQDQRRAIEMFASHLSESISSEAQGKRSTESFAARLDIERAITRFAKYPADLLEALLSEAGDPVLIAAFHGAVLTQRSAAAPLCVFEEARALDLIVPPQVWERSCLALIEAGREEEAIFCLSQLEDDSSGHYHAALAAALAKMSEASSDALFAMFQALQDEKKPAVLERVAAFAEARAAILRHLASLAETEKRRAELLSKIARILSSGETQALFAQSFDSAAILANLAPWLSVAQLKIALAQGTDWDFCSNERATLLLRLAEVGDYEAVLGDLQREVALWRSKEIIGRLAPHWPPDRLRKLFEAVRPDDIVAKTVMFSAAFLPHRPPGYIQRLVSELRAIDSPPERLEQLAMLLSFEMSPPDSDLVLGEIESLYRALLLEIGTNRVRHAVGEMIDRLPPLAAGRLSVSFVEGLAEALSGTDVAADQQLRWLVGIATGSAADAAREVAWRAAYRIGVASNDRNVYAWLAGAARPIDLPLIDRVADDIPDGRPLLLFSVTAGAAASEPTASKLLARIATTEEDDDRLYAYVALLPRAGSDARRLVESRERRYWEGGLDGVDSAMWELMLDVAAPESLDYAQFERRVASLPKREMLLTVIIALRLGRQKPWMLSDLADLFDDLDDEELDGVLEELAPALSLDQIAALLDREEWAKEASEPALAALAEAALAQNSLDLAFAVVLAAEGGLTRTSLLEALIPRLPLRGLFWCLDAAQTRSTAWYDERAVISGTQMLSKLAYRSAELGELGLAKQFLELKGGSSSSWDRGIAEIVAAFPEDHYDAAFDLAQASAEFDRPEAMAALAHRWPEQASFERLDRILESARSSVVPRLKDLLEPALRRLAGDDLLRLFSQAIRRSARGDRADVLAVADIFVRPLLTLYGAGVAAALDEACRIGCRAKWP